MRALHRCKEQQLRRCFQPLGIAQCPHSHTGGGQSPRPQQRGRQPFSHSAKNEKAENQKPLSRQNEQKIALSAPQKVLLRLQKGPSHASRSLSSL
jgi:hypothetical protein